MKHFTIKHRFGFFEYDCKNIETKIVKKRKLFSTVYELHLYPNNNFANKIEFETYDEAVRHAATIFKAVKTGQTLIELL